MPKGTKFGGRTKGTPNKNTLALQERMKRLKCDPFEVMALIAINQLPCGVCRGKGKTKFQPKTSVLQVSENTNQNEVAPPAGDNPKERVCQSCWGSGMERVSPQERGRAAGELAQYLEPKRKAIEISGDAERPAVRYAMQIIDSSGKVITPPGFSGDATKGTQK